MCCTELDVITGGGDGIVIEELDENVVALYLDEMKMKLEDDIFLPFKKLCKSRVEKVKWVLIFSLFLIICFGVLNSNAFQVETVVIEDDNPATGLLRYVRESGIDSLVLGSCSSNCFLRYVYFLVFVLHLAAAYFFFKMLSVIS